MTMLSLFAPMSDTPPTKARSRRGRPPLALDPDHIKKRVEAVVAVAMGEPIKKVAARIGVDRKTIGRWRNGDLKPPAA